MRNTDVNLPETDLVPDTQQTRRSIRLHRLGRRRLIVAGAIGAAGLLAGTGFTLQAAAEQQARVEATAAITNATGLDHDQLGAYRDIAAAKAIDTAKDTLTVATDALAAADGKVDASGLAASVASLGAYQTLSTDKVIDLTIQTKSEAEKARAAVQEYERVQAEQAAAAAAALAAANTPDGARAYAAELAASRYGWGSDQFSCLSNLWQKESGWNYQAYNASSGAAGIPQSLPGDKMATAGADWQTNARTQISWGLDYIQRAYGTPCSAWSHSQSMNWY
ncbi:hypothetical protein [Agromyces larvae]|uniref:Phospholipase n=1 Tax=Agromyces larvae TaxID=2929802 RepID=A0ABY4C0Y4_9MICO|nr:hypothetical protein [Agromyces larvae]UOE44844.1 hypothetical protein MTO99_03400 [Agromyces larvae]